LPRQRQYASQALKQAAYRNRLTNENNQLWALLYRLEQAVWQAADAGDPFASLCAASSPEAILRRLAQAFEQRCPPSKPQTDNVHERQDEPTPLAQS
jgi:hypothetical protein